MLTKLLNRLAFSHRYRQIERYDTEARSIQLKQLKYLLKQGTKTQFGAEYEFKKRIGYDTDGMPRYADFASIVPVNTYDEIKPWIERMLQGEKSVLWPGLVEWFAKSSGTTADKSKFIPVTRDALKRTHYKGGSDVVTIYLHLNPKSRFFSGKGLILGGSHKPTEIAPHIHAGDLSACLIQNINPLVNIVRTPSKEIALMDEWEAKLQALTHATKDENVTSLSGVPSWMMGLIKNVIEAKGAKVVLSRVGDEAMTMAERKAKFLENEIDMMFSIHCNAAGGTAHGTSTYYKHIQNRAFAKTILERLVEIEGVDEWGLVGNFNFSLAAPTEYPAVLVETLFLSYQPDEEKIVNPKFQKKMMKKVVEGIEDYLKYCKKVEKNK